jgi:hypothetical protein
MPQPSPLPGLATFQWANAASRPPHGFDTSDAARWFEVTAIGPASTVEIDLFGGFAGLDLNAGVSVRCFMSDTDCYIRFGATGIAAAAAGDFTMLANTLYFWSLLQELDRYCRVIRKTADGKLYCQDLSTLL